MGRKIFLFLFGKYTKNEKERLFVFNVLHEKVSDTYHEQTPFGNVYNANIEFIMSNDLIKRLVKENNNSALDMIKRGLNSSYEEAIKYMKNEKQ